MRRSPFYFALRISHFAPLLLAACQPQATRLLLLDERLTDPAQLEATARPWNAAGYTVEYRRFYPHLTRADLDRYRVVIVLGGSAPDVPANALTIGDVAVLTEWLFRGGVVVLGYPIGAAGTRDRSAMNQWLAWSGAGISIEETGLHDSSGGASPPALPVVATEVRELGFESFPAGDYHTLRVASNAQVLARADKGSRGSGGGEEHAARRAIHALSPASAAVVAARRASDGLILVCSRTTLGALAGADQVVSPRAPGEYEETRTFLVAVARWTRRPAEWARVPPAAPRVALAFGGDVTDTGVERRAPRGAPPQGADIEVLTIRRAPSRSDTTTRQVRLPNWASRQGLRALAGDLPGLDHRVPTSARAVLLDSLADFLEGGAFNVLLSNAHATAIIDSSHWSRWDRDATRAAWDQIAARLDASSALWIPYVSLREFAADSGYACPLDPRLWDAVFTPAVRTLARAAAAHRDVIPAIGLSLAGTPWGGTGGTGGGEMGAWICDADWQAGLAEMTADSVGGFSRARAARLDSIPPAARLDSLMESGLMARYQTALQRAVVRRATTLRTDARRIRPDLPFAVVTDRTPVDWFDRGLITALGGANAPVFLFAPDDGLTGSGPYELRAVRLDPGRLARIDPALARRVFRERDGFWLSPAQSLLGGPAQDLVHQLRRFAKER